MKCLNCGEELKEGIKFCANCGVEVKNDNVNNINNELGADESVVNNVIGPDIKPIDNNINNQNVMRVMSDVSNSKDKKKNSSKKPIIITIIVVVLLGIIACLLYLFVFNKKSAKSVFVDGFRNVTSSIFKDDGIKKQSLKQSIKYNISGTGIENYSEIINNIVLSNNANIDIDLKKLDEEITVNYKDSDIISIGIYARDNNIYLGINGLYDKYVKLPTEGINYSVFSSNKDNTKLLKETLDSAFEEAFDDKYFTKSNKTVNVNNKDTKLNAYTLTINNNNIKEIAKSFVNSLVNNDNMISIFGIDKNMLKSYLNEIDYNSITLDAPIEITIYTEGLKDSYKGIEIAMNSEGSKTSLRYFDIDSNNAELVIDMGITSFKMSINSEGDDSNNKTTAIIDMGIMKMSMIIDSIISNSVEFRNIDESKVVDYETFMQNGINDIMNNISNNNKIMEFLTDISSGFETSYASDIDIDYSTY